MRVHRVGKTVSWTCQGGGGINRTLTRQFAIFSDSLLADNAVLLGNFKRIKTGVNRKNDDVFFFGPEIQDIKNYL